MLTQKEGRLPEEGKTEGWKEKQDTSRHATTWGSDNLGYMLEWGENTTLEEPTILALQLVTHMGQPASVVALLSC